MSRNNNFGRNITGLNKVDTNTMITTIKNKSIATDSNGSFYGIANNVGYLKNTDGAGNILFSGITIF